MKFFIPFGIIRHFVFLRKRNMRRRFTGYTTLTGAFIDETSTINNQQPLFTNRLFALLLQDLAMKDNLFTLFFILALLLSLLLNGCSALLWNGQRWIILPETQRGAEMPIRVCGNQISLFSIFTEDREPVPNYIIKAKWSVCGRYRYDNRFD